jgi:hypothetical protein
MSEGGIVFSVMVSGDGEKDFLFLVFYFEPIPLYPPSLYKYLGKGELIRRGATAPLKHQGGFSDINANNT